MKLIDKIAVGILASVCLLMLTYPVTISSLPVVGSTMASGYDVLVSDDMERVTERLRIATTQFDKARPADLERPALPLSMRWGAFIKLFIALAYISAAVLLFGLLVSDFIVHVGGGLGMATAFAAVLHIHLFNADMHRYMHSQLVQVSNATGSNPFAGLERNMSELVAGGFNFQPGVALYVMTAAYFLAFFFSNTRVLSRASRGMERQAQQKSAPKTPEPQDLWPKS